VLISVGGSLLTGDPRALKRTVLIALATGIAIAVYTLVEKTAPAFLMTPPIRQDWMTNIGRIALMTPLIRTPGGSGARSVARAPARSPRGGGPVSLGPEAR
jgi:hypothetical protein